ncbi:ABC transporter permease subunit [Streptomyces sp. NRRL B-1677]|uniref:ABC transporter permease n=1 Tax=Streptomyces TaxID=1883 RepID=UPI0018929A77|nr:ABC transporter permease [Streptomyces sp. NRRL B-1677]MBF6046467.1 ABC transporter permease subunit [Streptomyces sp. NRRL B-1677]
MPSKPLMPPKPSKPSARTLARHPALTAGGILVTLVLALALLSLLWTPYDPTHVDAAQRLLPPGGGHVLGTDQFGRDVASRLMTGARTTVFVGVVAVGFAVVIGVPMGVAAGMSGGPLSALLMRVSDFLLAFPALLLAIMLAAVYGTSTLTAMVAIGIASAPGFARVARAATLRVMAAEYVDAARLARRTRAAIAVRHVLPNIRDVVIVQVSVAFATAVLAEAALSYLGLGTPPPTPSWGRMLLDSQELLFSRPELCLWPGLAVAAAVMGLNLLGDGLRDRFDPTLEGVR